MIIYSEGYKYQLQRDHTELTPVTGVSIVDDYFVLTQNGLLTVRKGYAWDGASGPTFDTLNSMRPSLVHDVFCQVLRDGRLDYVKWQDTVRTGDDHINTSLRTLIDECAALGSYQELQIVNPS